MLSYQSECEMEFYNRLLFCDAEYGRSVDTTPFEEWYEIQFLLARDHVRIPEVQGKLDKMLVKLNGDLIKLNTDDKIWLIDRYLENAKQFKEDQIKVRDRDLELDRAQKIYRQSSEYTSDLQYANDKRLYLETKDHKYKKQKLRWMTPDDYTAELNIEVLNPLIENLESLRNSLIPYAKPTSQIGAVYDDWKNYVNPLFVDLLCQVEEKVLNSKPTFDSTIRCAAFCELLYEKKYLINQKIKNRQTMASFATLRYRLNIADALKTSKKPARENHKIRKVSNLSPLKSFFL